MSLGLKTLLIFISISTFAYVIRKIKKSQVRIIDMSFWIIFSMLITILAVFPNIAEYFANLMGILSSVNFVFLAVIFTLLMEVFSLSVKVSKLESKVIDLSGEIALKSMEEIDAQRKDAQA